MTDGFPASLRDNLDTFQLGFSGDGKAWAAVEKRLYTSGDCGSSWSDVWETPEPILSIAC